MTIKEWQREVHQGARDHGWYDGELGEKTPVRIASMLCNVHSEVSEALEDVRAGRMNTSTQIKLMDTYNSTPEERRIAFGSPIKPEGFPTELADIMIRVMDMAEWLGIDLEEQIRIKNDYNKTRGTRHGGKVL